MGINCCHSWKEPWGITAAISEGNHGDYKEILEKIVCSVENRECVFHL